MNGSSQIPTYGRYPALRLRRRRDSAAIRRLVRENSLSVDDLIWPLFVIEGKDRTEPVPSMPGIMRISLDQLAAKARQAKELGIPALILFPYTEAGLKTPDAREATNPDNLICRAVKTVKDAVPELLVLTDIALDPYNKDGHDGLLVEGRIVNDPTLDVLAEQALVQAQAGSDTLGPSDMMDGRIGHIRTVLDREGYQDVRLLSYAVKYASVFYGPFRDAVGSSGALKGDKKTYQMDPANSAEALDETALDLAEGADMIMVKPGMPYLDIIHQLHKTFSVPVFAYQVSGEYTMIAAAAEQGWLTRDQAILESLMSFKRAGASGVLTYFAPEAAKLLGP